MTLCCSSLQWLSVPSEEKAKFIMGFGSHTVWPVSCLSPVPHLLTSGVLAFLLILECTKATSTTGPLHVLFL